MNCRLVAGLAITAAVIGACVVAEPATDPPTIPVQTPVILRAQVVPRPTAVISTWPTDGFQVPVQLSDPRVQFFATAFVDYNPITNTGYDAPTPSPPDLKATNPVRQLKVQITEPSSTSCHVIEIVVALAFVSTHNDSVSAHTPGQGFGADSISWFYSPGGDFAGCPNLDAGLSPLPSQDAGDVP